MTLQKSLVKRDLLCVKRDLLCVKRDLPTDTELSADRDPAKRANTRDRDRDTQTQTQIHTHTQLSNNAHLMHEGVEAVHEQLL